MHTPLQTTIRIGWYMENTSFVQFIPLIVLLLIGFLIYKFSIFKKIGNWSTSMSTKKKVIIFILIGLVLPVLTFIFVPQLIPITFLLLVASVLYLLWKLKGASKGILLGIIGLIISALFTINETGKGVDEFEAFYRFILYWQISSTILLWSVLLNKNMNLIFNSIFGVIWMVICGSIFLYHINAFKEYVPYSSNEIILGSVFVLQPILWFVVLFIGTIVIKYKSK